MRYIKYLIMAAMTVIAAACYKNKETSTEDKEREYLKAWLNYNGYHDLQPTETGMYILEDIPGTGATVEDSVYVAVHYDVSNLAGSKVKYSTDSVSKVMGTYYVTNRYKPHFWYMPSVSKRSRGMLLGMKVGETKRAITVPWQLDVETLEGISESSDNTLLDNTYTVCGIVKDMTQYQYSLLEAFKARHKYEADSIHGGFYVEHLTHSQSDTIPEGYSISVRYVGKYLDGQLFDTNIPDTAKYYRIYSGSDSDYSYYSMTFYTDSAKVISGNSSSIKGFALSLSKMSRYGDHYVTYFSSDWGYGNAGNFNNSTCSGIPAYSPLVFEIWIKDKE